MSESRRRLRRFTGEVARFSAVNTVATVVALVLFNALVHGVKGWFGGPMNGDPIPGYLVANSVGMFISYYGARYYAFRHRHAAGPGGGLLNYVIVNLASFVIPITCLFMSRNVFGWDSIYADNMAGNVIGAFLGASFRFWAFRRFVFTVRSPLIVEHVDAVDGVPMTPAERALHRLAEAKDRTGRTANLPTGNAGPTVDPAADQR